MEEKEEINKTIEIIHRKLNNSADEMSSPIIS